VFATVTAENGDYIRLLLHDGRFKKQQWVRKDQVTVHGKS